VQCGRWQKFSRMGGKTLEETSARAKKIGDRVDRFGGREQTRQDNAAKIAALTTAA
jgi:hypothetical protein